MRHLFFHVLFCLLCAITYAQDIREYVSRNTTSIANIDTLSNDYSDLESIGAAIGNARIVMLGEQDHGDAPTFLAKTRLIKYLHEKKGFNILAFESDFYALTTGWNQTPKDSIYYFLKKNIYSLWTSSDACHYLFKEYIPATLQTSQPLTVSGFDSQLYGTYSNTHLENDFINYLHTHHLQEKLTGDSTYEKFLIALQELLTPGRNGKVFSEEERRNILNNGLALLRDADTWWNTVIDNLVDFNNNTIETRDKRMALNLKYLANETYRNEKIIVWAANAHIMRYTDQLTSNKKQFSSVVIPNNMGTTFTNDPKFTNDTYVLGFASYEGTAGRLTMKTFKLLPPEKKGFEKWIPESMQFAFTDFKKYNQEFNAPKEGFLMKGPGHFTIPRSVAQIPWNMVYDGIFFIREMYAVKKLD